MCRKNIRKIDNSYHCSIIGTCLSLDEVRNLLEKAFGEDFSECTDYLLHGMAVRGAGEMCRFSNRLTEKLDSKYKTDIYQSSKCTSPIALESYWGESLSEGNIAGAYWAVLSHPECSRNLLEEAFGEVHMLSHISGSCERAKLQELQTKDIIIASLKKRVENYRSRIVKAAEDKRKLEKENSILKTESDETQRTAGVGKAEETTGLQSELTRYKSKLTVYEQRNERLQKRLFIMMDELNQSLEYNHVMSSFAPTETCLSECLVENAQADPINLKGKKVLLVGGRVSMVPHCKAVVEAMNGRFVYHDGGKEQSRIALKKLTGSADVVICALDCVSHDTSRCVKRFCCEAQQIIMMKNSGLSTFARELKSVV